MAWKWGRSAKARFWEKIAVRDPDDCWLWEAAIDRHGYGVFTPDTSTNRQWRAHRWAWVEAGGMIPRGTLVLHLCDNRRCCNPSHLTVGSHRQNMRERCERAKRDPRHKLSEAQELDIRTRYAPGRPRHVGNGPKLMAEYAISRTTLYRVLHSQ
jgi:HNH endonuclease